MHAEMLQGLLIVEIQPILAFSVMFFGISYPLATHFLRAWFASEPGGEQRNALSTRTPISISSAENELNHPVFIGPSRLTNVQLKGFSQCNHIRK